MIINFKIREINRVIYKLTRIFILIKKNTRMTLQAKKMCFLFQSLSVKKLEKLILRNRSRMK